MRSFRLSDRALFSLEEIGEYTEMQWGRSQRDKYLDSLDACFSSLAQSPMKGRSRDDIAFGLYRYQHNKHVIFYFIQGNELHIVDILHERMDIDTRMEGWTQP